MRRWRPRSLAGQMALLIGLALLVAQLANFALILNERQKLGLWQDQGPALTTLASVAADFARTPDDLRPALLADNSRRGIRLATAATSGIADRERDADLEARMREALADSGATATAVVASTTAAAGDRRNPRDGQMLRIAIRQSDKAWLNARLYTPRRDPWLGARLGAATLLLYLLVLGASLWLVARIARPLRDLTRAVERFRDRAEPIAERGPDDVAGAIRAFNAMSARVAALIGEKDVMLGAIGHDLRNPLASLRLRVEAMDPADERAAAVATLEEMGRTLENILTLARTGRTTEAARRTDVAALVEALADDYADAGAPVRFSGTGREVAPVHADMLRQGLRNLIDNAIKYGGSAELAVTGTPDAVTIVVSDPGPGIPADEREAVLAPFHRREASRNRDSGGAGLGLAIANGIAGMHGGTLHLDAAIPHGLRATITLPR